MLFGLCIFIVIFTLIYHLNRYGTTLWTVDAFNRFTKASILPPSVPQLIFLLVHLSLSLRSCAKRLSLIRDDIAESALRRRALSTVLNTGAN